MQTLENRCAALMAATFRLAPTVYLGRPGALLAGAPDVLRQVTMFRAVPRHPDTSSSHPPRHRGRAFAARVTRRAATLLSRRARS